MELDPADGTARGDVDVEFVAVSDRLDARGPFAESDITDVVFGVSAILLDSITRPSRLWQKSPPTIARRPAHPGL